ncbi:MAG: DHH family phosphoesterase [Oscillospiraceae bacterium]|jgi:phosphoesterase RecJ-like protein|nr:DHH family phosphoesterase [Oscillospiraceae bacterium]
MRIPEPFLQALADGQRFLLCLHTNPDGDTLGSALALGMALESLGKQVTWVSPTPPGESYIFLPGVGQVRTPAQLAESAFDTAVAVDVSDHSLMAGALPLFQGAPVRLVVDHHPTNPGYGQINWIEPGAAATGMLVQALLARLGVPLIPAMATCLYVAISTDTGHFQFGNADGEALRAAAALVDAGVDVARVTRLLYRIQTRAKLRLLTCALNTLVFDATGRVAGIALSRGDFEQSGASQSDTEGIVQYAIQTQGVEAAFLARETEEGIKFSLRALAPYNVAVLAQCYGGGGHAQAAGCTLQAPLDQACAQMMRTLHDMLDRG